MINNRLFLKNQQINSTLVCAIENQLNQVSNKSKLSCTVVRTVTSAKPVAKKELKKYEDIPGPPNVPFLGNVLGFKNPETGHDPKHILKTGRHLWKEYGDMFKLEVPGKNPIIWYVSLTAGVTRVRII